ncbi:MAG: VOC family protein [Planctomycetota bacterium]|jgi:catechol 2,3-dioxygenase-like lactoylglutathione lyase family enzyme|nr:VOC family protein [Planctomycetota bacterium]
MITALAHVCITAIDLEATHAFYVQALGLTEHFRFERDGAVFGYYFRIDERNFIEVFGGGDAPKPAGGIRHLCLQVDDIDAIEARLAEHGVATRGKKIGGDGSWQLWCQDPNGVDIEFHQYTPASSQYTQATVVVDW